MNEITTEIRLETLKLIVEAMIMGSNQRDACEKYNVPVRTFQVNIARHPEIKDQLVRINSDALTERLQRISELRLRLVDRIVNDVSSNLEELSLKDIFAAEARLEHLQKEISGEAKIKDPVANAIGEAAAEYLRRLPKLTKASPAGMKRVDENDQIVDAEVSSS